MLFGYPVAATAENWLHECLCQMLVTIHASLDAGVTLPLWPGIIPAAHRAQIKKRTGLRDRLYAYSVAASGLSPAERQQVMTCLDQENRIADLVACSSDCDSLADLPPTIQAPVAELFSFAFGLLTSLDIRNSHYSAIYDSTANHVCPFCGCEFFDAPGAPREDLDHYLPKSIYPFAAANLRNLVPMGMKCNERYKLSQDILRDATGARRRSFDPYSDHHIQVILERSVPFGSNDGRLPDWQIDFYPDSEECTTWDNVFDVRKRFKRDVLDRSFSQWLENFAAWYKRRIGIPDPNNNQITQAMQQYLDDLSMLELSGREFLRKPVFQMLHSKCAAGDARLNDFLRYHVTSALESATGAV